MSLNTKQLNSLKPKEKIYTVADGDGLSIRVLKTGSKLWYFRYRFEDKAKMLSFGKYPEISLSDARVLLREAREKVAKGIDPSQERQNKKAEVKAEVIAEAKKIENTFENITIQYLSKRTDLNEGYVSRLHNAFNNDVFPFIGSKEVKEVTTKEVKAIILRVEERGAIESAHRLFTQISTVFKYAVAHDIAERNVCADIDKNMILKSPVKNNFATITNPKKIGILLNVMDEYKGDYTTKMALKLAPHVFLRPYNLRHAEWSEIDLEKRLWKIEAKKMKTKNEFIIPLTQTVIDIFEEMHLYSHDSIYVFPSLRHKTRPMSENTMNGALRRLGYTKNEIVPHGFRAMFSTIAHEESGFDHQVIETQLAHSVGSSVSQAYNRAIYLDKRTELMEWWTNYLNDVKAKEA